MSRSELQLNERIQNLETLIDLEKHKSNGTGKNNENILRRVHGKLDQVKPRIENESICEQIPELFTELEKLNKLSIYTDPIC